MVDRISVGAELIGLIAKILGFYIGYKAGQEWIKNNKKTKRKNKKKEDEDDFITISIFEKDDKKNKS